MSETNPCRVIFDLLTSLSREIRCCSRDEALCGGLTFQQFLIVDAVIARGALALADLRSLLSVEKSTMTRLVNPLLRRGILRRETACHDFRAAVLSATEEGVQAHRRAWGCLEGFFGDVLESLPPERRTEVMASLDLLTGALRRTAAAYKCCT